MVTFNDPDIYTINLTQNEQLALLQYCVNIPSDIHQKLFSAADGMLILTFEQCNLLRKIVELSINHTNNPQTADILIKVSHKLITNPTTRKIAEELDKNNFETIEQAQSYANAIRIKHNNSPDPLLGGLSPYQVNRLINLEWNNPDFPIKFEDNLNLEQVKDTPLFHNSVALLQELIMRNNENTATAKGNLTRKVVKALLDTVKIDNEHDQGMPVVLKVINEYDAIPIWISRIVCQQAGLIRKFRNKFIVTKKAAELLKPEISGRLYYLLFFTYFRKFNIGFYDLLPDLPGLQYTISYTLYHLNHLAQNQVSFESIYRKIMLPAVLDELRATETEYIKASWIIKLRTIEPLEYAGLLNCQKKKIKYFPEIVSLKISPLFRSFMKFRF